MPSESAAHTLHDPAVWVDEHGDSLYRFALTRVSDPGTAEDLVQETFLAALRGKDRYTGAATERTWLFGILKHKLADHARRHRPQTGLAALGSILAELFNRQGHWRHSVSDWAKDPAAIVENAEFWQSLDECLAKLPPSLSETFASRELHGHTSDRVCEIMGITARNLAVRLYRARLLLRQCLESAFFRDER